MLTREVIGTVLVSLVFAVAAYIFFAIRKRRSAQEQGLPSPEPAKPGQEIFGCLYVATVFANSPLERVWAYGLGIRGRASLCQHPDGLSLHRQGEKGFFIPFADLIAIERASATIDRGVERAGLVQVAWMLGSQQLLTSLRITQNQEKNISRLMTIVKEAN